MLLQHFCSTQVGGDKQRLAGPEPEMDKSVERVSVVGMLSPGRTAQMRGSRNLKEIRLAISGVRTWRGALWGWH